MGRKLGQHLLVRGSLLRRIAAAVCPEPCGLVVEIGPGAGALTEHLLERCDRLIGVEVDAAMVARLRRRFSGAANLEIIHADVLATDIGQWGEAAVAGNLPYYISSPIIERTLALGPRLHHAVFLIQKEVAARLTARPGSRDYGFLTVKTQLYAEPRVLFPVPPSAFRPPPKVDSAVVKLSPRVQPLAAAPQEFLRFASHCFRHKRKTLRSNLKALWPAIDEQREKGLRAEQLSIAELIDLHHRLTR